MADGRKILGAGQNTLIIIGGHEDHEGDKGILNEVASLGCRFSDIGIGDVARPERRQE